MLLLPLLLHYCCLWLLLLGRCAWLQRFFHKAKLVDVRCNPTGARTCKTRHLLPVTHAPILGNTAFCVQPYCMPACECRATHWTMQLGQREESTLGFFISSQFCLLHVVKNLPLFPGCTPARQLLRALLAPLDGPGGWRLTPQAVSPAPGRVQAVRQGQEPHIGCRQ